MTTTDDDQTYARATGIVWRVGPNRVLLHRIGVPPEKAALELTGRVAFVWIALDEPGTAPVVAERLHQAELGALPAGAPEFDVEAVAGDLVLLVDAGVVHVADPGADG